MNNYKLTIQYDGTNYSGWQIQKNANTIQQEIINGIKIITKEDVNLIGSGRTDSGVHALGQVANFKIEKDLDLFRFRYSLNSILPDEIAVTNIELADESFHARFDAQKRSYLYLISSEKSPFYKNYSFKYTDLSNNRITELNKLSEAFKGLHDFTSFARKKTEVENKVCEIYNIHWRKSGFFTIFYIEANRFLHGMVKSLVGTLLYAERNNLDENYIKEILKKKDREEAGEAAPSKGLFLYKVRY